MWHMKYNIICVSFTFSYKIHNEVNIAEMCNLKHDSLCHDQLCMLSDHGCPILCVDYIKEKVATDLLLYFLLFV